MKFYHIVAADRCGAIGNENTIPWKSREDMRHFKRVTMGKVLIMGRKTYESLPEPKLPGRYLVIVSRSLQPKDVPADVIVSHSIKTACTTAVKIAKRLGQSKVYVAGGSEIYLSTTKMIDGVVLSRIGCTTKHADAYYTTAELSTMQLVKQEQLDVEKGAHPVTVSYYERI